MVRPDPFPPRRSRRRPAFAASAFALTFVLLAALPAAAQGTLRLEQRFESAAFAATSASGGEVRYAVYLPPGYDAPGASERYPLLILLHGSGGSETDFLLYGDLQATLDRLIAAGELPPLIAVTPSDNPVWYTTPEERQEALERFLVEELVAHLDAAYRTRAEPEARFALGVSLGGYHAVYQALKHPDVFGAAASLSGPFWSPSPTAFRRTTMLGWFFGSFERAAARSVYTVMGDGGVAGDGDAADRPAVYLVSGDEDGFLPQTLELYGALREAGVPAELRVTDGGHGWRVWRAALPGALRFFGERLERE